LLQVTQTDYFYAKIYRITRSKIFGIFVSSLNVFLLTPVIFSVHSTLCHIEEGSTLNSNDELVKVKTAMKLKNCNNYPHFSLQKKNKWALPFISHSPDRKTNLFDFATVAITLFFYGLLLWIFFYWNRISQSEKLNQFPNYLFVHFVQ
jgi:hypothetical protein